MKQTKPINFELLRDPVLDYGIISDTPNYCYCAWGVAVVALVCKSVSQHNWWKTEAGEAHSFTGTEVALPSFHSFAPKEQQIVQISLIFAISGYEKSIGADCHGGKWRHLHKQAFLNAVCAGDTAKKSSFKLPYYSR